jgi:putative acetyltransferase
MTLTVTVLTWAYAACVTDRRLSTPGKVVGWATPTDHDELADIVFDAVRNGPSLYTEAQRAAWVPVRRGGEEWAERLKGQVIAIARDETRIVGFMSLAPEGYIDFAFIRPEAQGTGLFRRLFAMIEDKARSQNEPRLWTHASLMAEPAFAAVGFAVVEREVVEIDDEGLERAKMEKTFSKAAG